MKKLLVLIPALLIFAGCASQPAHMSTRYVLDGDGNIAQQQYMVPAKSDNRLLETVAIVGLGIVGLYFVGEVFDVWDDDPAPAPAQGPSLIPSSGHSSTTTTSDFDTQFITPGFVSVN